MARYIITPPDMESDRSIPKVLIRNCYWTPEQVTAILGTLSDKLYDIYIYNDTMNDIQWAEGIRTQSVKNFDWRHYQNLDPIQWLRSLDEYIR